MKRLLVYGNGSFDLKGRSRDGSVYTRRGLIKWCNENSIQFVWLGKYKDEEIDDLIQTIEIADVIGDKKGPYELNDDLPKGDFLLVEGRTRVFGPFDAGYDQGKVLEWYCKNTNIKIGIWDFDLNIYNILGKKGKVGLYPWISEYLNRFVGFIPYELTETILSKHNLQEFKTMYWPINTETLKPIEKDREIDLLYNGSDYNRRAKFKEFYGDISEQTDLIVKFSGVWKKKDSQEFLSQFPKLQHTGYVKLNELQDLIRNSLAVIQIVRKDYEPLGYHTERMQEVPFFGTVCLGDRQIKNIEKFCPEDLIVYTTSEAIEKLKWLKSLSYEEYSEVVEMQRKHLLNNHNTYVTGYKQLLEYI